MNLFDNLLLRMKYLKSTKGIFSTAYAILAGICLIVWVFAGGAQNTKQGGKSFTGIPLAHADASCGNGNCDSGEGGTCGNPGAQGPCSPDPEGGGSGESGGSGNTGAAGGDPGCFVASTPISLADGTTKPIAEVEIGDEVKAFGEDGVIENKKVVNKKVHDSLDTVLLNEVTTTLDHRFLTSSGEFKRVDELTEGDMLVDENGNAVAWTLQKLEQKETVYNLEVEDLHTYIAGGYRVHNWK